MQPPRPKPLAELKADAEDEFRVLDSLPKVVRDAMHDSPYPWDARSVATQLARGVPPAFLATKLREVMPDIVAQSYGPTHPEAEKG